MARAQSDLGRVPWPKSRGGEGFVPSCSMGVKERDSCCWSPCGCPRPSRGLSSEAARGLRGRGAVQLPALYQLGEGGRRASVATRSPACNSASRSAAGAQELAAEDERRRSGAGEAEKRGRRQTRRTRPVRLGLRWGCQLRSKPTPLGRGVSSLGHDCTFLRRACSRSGLQNSSQLPGAD